MKIVFDELLPKWELTEPSPSRVEIGNLFPAYS